MIYIDSNIFFYAKIMDRKYGKACADIIEKISEGEIEASISPLVILEVTNAMKKYGMRKDIKNEADAILSLDIEIFPIDSIVARLAMEIFEEVGISPYDCTHIAVMKRYEIKRIFSADKEFDRVPGIKRIDPLKQKLL